MDDEQRILCRAARTRLDAGAQERLAALLRGGVDWQRLWSQAHLHDVLPLVAATLRQLPGPAPVPADWLGRAERRLYATLVRNQALKEELVHVVAALRDVGVEPMAVKGVVLAQTVYGSLALRPAADLDVLVRPGDLQRARLVLAERGYGHRERLLFEEARHPYHDPQYFRASPRGEFCLELHHALWDARHFRHDDGIWERAVVTELAAVRTLSPEDTLLHLAIHRTRSPLRLRLLCDVAELLRRCGPTLAWDPLIERARAVGARTALHAILGPAAQLLDAPVPPDVPLRLGVRPVRRRLLSRTCGAQAVFRAAPDEDLTQQTSLALRAFEQDGAGRITRTLARGVVRKGSKLAYARRSG